MEQAYRDLGSYDLGDVQFVRASQDITVANIIGQDDISPTSRFLDARAHQYPPGSIRAINFERLGLIEPYRKPADLVPPIRYEAIEQGLRVVHYYTTLGSHAGASIHMPRGGSWLKMEPVIKSALKDLSVTVYDF